MKSHQRISLYRERLTCWVQRPAISGNFPKPEPKDFGITDNQTLFMAQRIHDEVVQKPK